MRYALENFNVFRDAAHKASRDAGWWSKSERYWIYDHKFARHPDPDRLTIPTKLCLIHSEISEFYDGYASGTSDEHLPHYLNAPVEAGDTLIRIGDLAGYLNIDMTAAIAMVLQADALEMLVHSPEASNLLYIYPATVHQLFNKLHGFTSAAMEGFRKSAPDKIIPARPALDMNLARVVILVDMIARKNDWAIEEITEAKMAYNAVRQDHKAEVRATTGGKAF